MTAVSEPSSLRDFFYRLDGTQSPRAVPRSTESSDRRTMVEPTVEWTPPRKPPTQVRRKPPVRRAPADVTAHYVPQEPVGRRPGAEQAERAVDGAGELRLSARQPQARDRNDVLSGLFAAKEAVSKALGTGIGQVAWQDIEIIHLPSGQPTVRLHGHASSVADQLGLQEWSVSISHDRNKADAMAVAIGG